MRIKRLFELVFWLVFGLGILIILEILHCLRMIKVDDEYGF